MCYVQSKSFRQSSVQGIALLVQEGDVNLIHFIFLAALSQYLHRYQLPFFGAFGGLEPVVLLLLLLLLALLDSLGLQVVDDVLVYLPFGSMVPNRLQQIEGLLVGLQFVALLQSFLGVGEVLHLKHELPLEVERLG